MKIKKKISLIDQHDKFGMWGGKFGGNFIPETLNLLKTLLFEKLRKDKKFIEEKDYYFRNWLDAQPHFINSRT